MRVQIDIQVELYLDAGLGIVCVNVKDQNASSAGIFSLLINRFKCSLRGSSVQADEQEPPILLIHRS